MSEGNATPSNRRRWDDYRLDDIATLVRGNTEAIGAIRNLLAAHDLQLIEVDRERRSRLEQRFSYRLALFTVVAAQVLSTFGVIAVILLAHHGH